MRTEMLFMKTDFALSAAILLAATILSSVSLIAQVQNNRTFVRISPPDVVTRTFGQTNDNRVTIYYSRPFTRDPQTGETRKIWGGVIPFGKVWRAGANEATLLVTMRPLKFGAVEIPAGAHTLFLLPNADDTSKLIINKEVGQWGTQYKEGMDLARVDMKKETLNDPVSQFTITVLASQDGSSGVLKMSWEKTAYSTTFIVK
jgi:hypothetical protein